MFSTKKNPFCFIHIEKAGGSTLHNWLKYYIPNYISLYPWFYWSNEKGNYFTQKELKILNCLHPVLQGFGGHTTRHYLGYEHVFKERVLYFTFLREPISRYLSQYQYQKHQMKIDWTLEGYINEPKFNNYMTVRIAGEHNAPKAVDEINNQYAFVGLVEKFNESILLLSDILQNSKLKPFYEKRNVGSKKKKIIFKELPLDIQNKIIENNKEDIKLYQEISKHYYPRQLEGYNGDIQKKLLEMNEQIKDYKYKKIRKEIIRVYKGYNHYISEPIAHFFR